MSADATGIAAAGDPHFDYDDDPDHPGWRRWALRDDTRFNALLGPIVVRAEGDRRVRVRMLRPERRHSNLAENVHGGVVMSFADIALFAAARTFGLVDAGGAVTLEMSFQFIGAGRQGEPLDAEVELLRETGRLLFERGLVTQGDTLIANFAGTIRKQSRA